VTDGLEGIPVELGANMENVAVIMGNTSPPGPLFGLYEGSPLTCRGNLCWEGNCHSSEG
jgi:hypothetical protein